MRAGEKYIEGDGDSKITGAEHRPVARFGEIRDGRASDNVEIKRTGEFFWEMDLF